MTPVKARAPRNKTLTCSASESLTLRKDLISVVSDVTLDQIENKIIHQNLFAVIPHLPRHCVDLLVLDPPYNLFKNYNGYRFKHKTHADYQKWFTSVIQYLKPLLTRTATVYVCSDWQTSLLIAPLLEQELYVRNRITWERGKGRGAKENWKNNSEDIWFCTVSPRYTFNVDAVKLKRKVITPYRTEDGHPKDWKQEASGNFRLTHPSNIWTDITIPFWSMAENTDHPTQKPEKLMAKLILASSKPRDVVFDPFLGSGTTAVVAKKLGRKFIGVEINQDYCCWALKRLNTTQAHQSIQGYAAGVFCERNTFGHQVKEKTS